MADQPSSPFPDKIPPAEESDYVIEHYGFASRDGAAATHLPAPGVGPRRSADRGRRPARDRGRRILAAGALGLVLTGGIGGIAAAAGAPGGGARGDGDRAGIARLQDGAPSGQRGSFDGQPDPR
jgi:hypothetical protein